MTQKLGNELQGRINGFSNKLQGKVKGYSDIVRGRIKGWIDQLTEKLKGELGGTRCSTRFSFSKRRSFRMNRKRQNFGKYQNTAPMINSRRSVEENHLLEKINLVSIKIMLN